MCFFDETGGLGIEFSKLPFDHLLFTGSGTTGRAVMAAAAHNLVPVTLELGGKAPAIVCDDFDLALAAERILFIKALNAGQICTTVDHAYVPEDRIQAFVDLARRLVPQRYAGLDSPDYTSIIDRRAYERLRAALEDARERGATVTPLLPGPAFDDERHRIAPPCGMGADDLAERDEVAFDDVLDPHGTLPLGQSPPRRWQGRRILPRASTMSSPICAPHATLSPGSRVGAGSALRLPQDRRRVRGRDAERRDGGVIHRR